MQKNTKCSKRFVCCKKLVLSFVVNFLIESNAGFNVKVESPYLLNAPAVGLIDCTLIYDASLK